MVFNLSRGVKLPQISLSGRITLPIQYSMEYYKQIFLHVQVIHIGILYFYVLSVHLTGANCNCYITYAQCIFFCENYPVCRHIQNVDLGNFCSFT